MRLGKSGSLDSYRRTTLLIVGFVVLCIFAAFRLTDYLSDRELVDQKVRTDVANRNLAMILTESVSSAIRNADILLRIFKGDWENSGALTESLQAKLPEIINAGMVARICIADESGKIVFNAMKLAHSSNIASHKYFQKHRAEDAGEVLLDVVWLMGEQELTYSSYHDALTGIYNRAYFYDKVREAGPQAGVIMADMDGLKVINDTFGHKVGDRALIDTAGILLCCISPDSIAARIGGDEFAVYAPATTRDSIEKTIQALRQEITRFNDSHDLPLHLSIGFALSDGKELPLADLMATADKWMYREKLRQARTHRSQFTNTLKEMLVARDYITEGHVSRVTDITIALAKAVGLPSAQIPDMELFAYFHDIGKVGVSDRILKKCGPLTENERHEMQQHSEIGHRIASATDDLSGIADWILKHHERWDGKGYPWGIAGEDIPVQCRILVIADAYDAMTSDRPYRKAMSRQDAIAELRRNAGTQFDPALVGKFIELQGLNN